MDGPKKRKLAEDIADSTSVFPSRGALKKILEVVGSDQIVDLVLTAAALHRDFLEVINDVIGKDTASRKLFVRGLGFDSTTETLRQTFAVHGEVVEGIVITDKLTGKSRGFGFVTFKDLCGVLSALTQPTRVIDGRLATCQLAAAGSQQLAAQPGDVANRKIYVGNVPASSTYENLKTLFSQFGEIEDGPIGFDKVTQKSRGYGLILYKSEESAKRALEATGMKIDGQDLFCKIATDGGKARPRQLDTQALQSYPTAPPAGNPGGMLTQAAGYSGSQIPSPMLSLNGQPQYPSAGFRYHPADSGMANNFYTSPPSSAYPTAIMTALDGSQVVVAANGHQHLPQRPQYILQSESGGVLHQQYGGPTPLPPQTPNPHHPHPHPHPQYQQPPQQASILGTPTLPQMPLYAPPQVFHQQQQQGGGGMVQYANMPSYEQLTIPQQDGTGGGAYGHMQKQAPPVPSQLRPP